MKPSLLIILIVAISCNPLPKLGKQTMTLPDMVGQTKKIMNHLKIDIRSHLNEDGNLILESLDSLNINTYSAFYFDFMSVPIDSNNLAYRSYPNPKIFISKKVNEIINGEKKTTEVMRLYNMSSIIHETTHYLQSTFDTTKMIKPQGPKSYINYVMRPLEFESFAVQSYYFLYYTHKRELKKLLQDKDRDIRFKKLINAFHSYMPDNKQNLIPFPMLNPDDNK